VIGSPLPTSKLSSFPPRLLHYRCDFCACATSLAVLPFLSVKKSWLLPLALLLIVVTLWLSSWAIIAWAFPTEGKTDGYTTRGQFGDMFGAVNSLFSGLALAGVVYTIYLQHREIEEQRKEAKENEEFRRSQTAALNAQVDALRSTVGSLQEQLSLQKQAALPALDWGSIFSGGPNEVRYKFINKGGRFRIERVTVVDSSNVAARAEPSGYIAPNQEASIIFFSGQRFPAPFTCKFEVHYQGAHGNSSMKVFTISDGKKPVEIEA
jgi:hypothetical protein